MGTSIKLDRLPVDRYLQMEQRGEDRHEYVQGIVHAMVGGTVRHNQITLTVASALRTHVKGKPFTVFMSDMKVRVDNTFYYPDVMVVNSPVNPQSMFQTAPVLLVEVLSKWTEAKDRIEKLVVYQNIPSVVEYAFISQDEVSVDIYRRDGGGWQLESLSYGDTIDLASVSYNSTVETLYEGVLSSQ